MTSGTQRHFDAGNPLVPAMPLQAGVRRQDAMQEAGIRYRLGFQLSRRVAADSWHETPATGRRYCDQDSKRPASRPVH